MDEVEGKGADYNEHCHGKQLHCGVFFKRGFLIRQHQIRHLNDVELLFKADGLCDIPIRKEQVCKVIVRKGFDMVGYAGADGGSLRPKFLNHFEKPPFLTICHCTNSFPKNRELFPVTAGNAG